MIAGIVVNTALGILLTTSALTSPLISHKTNTIMLEKSSSMGISTFVYVVQKSDTLSSIAKKLYKNEDNWKLLWNDNPQIKDPDNLTGIKAISVKLQPPSACVDLAPALAEKWNKLQTTQAQASTLNFVESPLVATRPAPNGTFMNDYMQAGSQYHVPWQILYALHQVESGGKDGTIFNGAGSGARGPMQFMPGTWNAYKTPDHSNIDSAQDSIYVAAKYLAAHGNNQGALSAYGTNVAIVDQIAAQQGLTSY